MEKVICIYRTSTDRQEIEAQKKEVISMALSDGYKPEEIKLIGNQGASAIKLDKKYLKQMEDICDTIKNENIECVYVWSIDRIGRNEEVLMKFKNILIDNKVQLKINNMSTTLFDKNWEVDKSFELVYAFFAIQAKQEMELKQERFERSRKRNVEAGVYNGGREIRFGYSVNESGKIVINNEEAETVRMLYNMMASGKYSYYKLAIELKSRGMKFRNTNVTFKNVERMFNSPAYIGKPFGKSGIKYPVIISEDLYNRTKEVIANNNRIQNKETKHSYFANKLIKCNCCGTYFTNVNGDYKCSKRMLFKQYSAMKETKHLCYNNISLKAKNVDGWLWTIAQDLHWDYMSNVDANKKKELTDEKNVLLQKIEELERRIEEVAGKKRANIIDMYADAEISKEEKNRRLAKVDEEVREYNLNIADYKNRISNIELLLNKNDEILPFDLTDLKEIDSINEKKMSDIVHRYISNVDIERYTMPKVIAESNINEFEMYDNEEAISKLSNKECLKITITTYMGYKVYLYYFPKFKRIPNTWRGKDIIKDGDVITEFRFDPVIRENGKCQTEEMILKNKIISKYNELLPKIGSERMNNYLENAIVDGTKELDELLNQLRKKYSFTEYMRMRVFLIGK